MSFFRIGKPKKKIQTNHYHYSSCYEHHPECVDKDHPIHMIRDSFGHLSYFDVVPNCNGPPIQKPWGEYDGKIIYQYYQNRLTPIQSDLCRKLQEELKMENDASQS